MDGQLSWQDFLNAYFRSQADASGFEPKRFFFVAEYLLMDEDKSGHITLDEAMKLLFSRSKGRADAKKAMEEMTKSFFGHVDPRRDDDGQVLPTAQVTFGDYFAHFAEQPTQSSHERARAYARAVTPPGSRADGGSAAARRWCAAALRTPPPRRRRVAAARPPSCCD